MKPLLRAAGQSCRRFPNDTAATTAIEFGIVAPLLFAIMFGIIGFGVQFAARIGLVYAATEGGRAAVAGLTDTERNSLARTGIPNTLTSLSPLIDASKATVTVNLTNEASDQRIDISITYGDTRFAVLPYVPTFSTLNPVTVSYYVTDPAG